jgi:hypothetical protein
MADILRGKINARSNFYITETANSGFEIFTINVDLYIYTGKRITDRPASPTYSLTKTVNKVNASFNISNFIKDFIDTKFNGVYEHDIAFCDVQLTVVERNISNNNLQNLPASDFYCYKAYFGYGYFEDGINPTNEQLVMLSNDTIITYNNSVLNIPVDALINENQTESVIANHYVNGDLYYQEEIIFSDLSDDAVVYISNSPANLYNFEQRVLSDGGTFENSSCLTSFEQSLIQDTSIEVLVGTDSQTVRINSVYECLHTPIKATFYNMFGALQDFWFFKGSKSTLDVKSESYRRDNIIDGSYSVSDHSYKNFLKNGREKLKLYSGFYPESYNEVFRQFMLSEDVWIEFNGQTLPVNLKSESHDFKTRIREGLISFEVDVELAYDKINII